MLPQLRFGAMGFQTVSMSAEQVGSHLPCAGPLMACVCQTLALSVELYVGLPMSFQEIIVRPVALL